LEDLISLQDAAKLFGVKADRLRRAAWDGRLVSRMVGNQRRPAGRRCAPPLPRPGLAGQRASTRGRPVPERHSQLDHDPLGRPCDRLPTGVFRVHPHAASFFQQSSVEQIRTLFQSALQSQRRQEWPDPPWRDTAAHQQYQWRLVLISALMALPPAQTFVAIDDLVDALFVRIGQTFPSLARWLDHCSDTANRCPWANWPTTHGRPSSR
jgi:hypothetical protein